MAAITIDRKTKETQISITLDIDSNKSSSITTGLPFFDHMLMAMAHHGGFHISVQAAGDLEVDPHHVVEDVGLVLGQAFYELFEERKNINRYAWALIPMDEALSEVAIDVCNRPTCVYNCSYPQPVIGQFDTSLFQEFFIAFTNKAAVSLHLSFRYGRNSHHMVEALYKAFGKVLFQAYSVAALNRLPSTKGVL